MAGSGIKNPGNELLTCLTTISWCGERLGRWPTASDASRSIPSIQSYFQKIVDKYGHKEVMDAIEGYSGWDSRMVREQYDELKSKQIRSIVNSPLFLAIKEKYPHLDLETLKDAYESQSKKIVAAGLYLLRREFKNNQPPDINVKPEHWPRCWSQHLPTYLKQWQSELKEIEIKTKSIQQEWEVVMF